MLDSENRTTQPITTIAMADTASTQPATSEDRARIVGTFDEASGEIMATSGSGRRSDERKDQASDERHDRKKQGDRQGTQQDVGLRERPAGRPLPTAYDGTGVHERTPYTWTCDGRQHNDIWTTAMSCSGHRPPWEPHMAVATAPPRG